MIFSAGAFSQSVVSLKEFIIEDRLSNGDGEDLLLLPAPAQVETGAFAELQNLKKVNLGLKVNKISVSFISMTIIGNNFNKIKRKAFQSNSNLYEIKFSPGSLKEIQTEVRRDSFIFLIFFSFHIAFNLGIF